MAETHHRVPASTHIHLLGLCPVQSHIKDRNHVNLDFTGAGTPQSALFIKYQKSLTANFVKKSYHVIHFLLFTISGIIFS